MHSAWGGAGFGVVSFAIPTLHRLLRQGREGFTARVISIRTRQGYIAISASVESISTIANPVVLRDRALLYQIYIYIRQETLRLCCMDHISEQNLSPYFANIYGLDCLSSASRCKGHRGLQVSTTFILPIPCKTMSHVMETYVYRDEAWTKPGTRVVTWILGCTAICIRTIKLNCLEPRLLIAITVSFEVI